MKCTLPNDVYSIFNQKLVASDIDTESVHGGPVPSLGDVRLSQHRSSNYSFLNARGVRLVATSLTNNVPPVGLVYISYLSWVRRAHGVL